MPMPSRSVIEQRPTTRLFEFEAFESLPCGCVAAAYRARAWDLAVISVEAKGPHCIFSGHAEGQIVRLGETMDLDEEDVDE